MTSFSDLRSANTSRQEEWNPDDAISLAYRGNELGGECGEAMNVIKKLERERLGIRGSRATVDDLASELADVMICADLIAMQAGIDLGKAVVDKFNATSEKYDLSTRMEAATATAGGNFARAHVRLLIDKAAQLGHSGETMASWVIGELMLADPWMRLDQAQHRYQQAIGGR
jgi:NTP pyrophosphatase (non-canonical NTP hydrolase)